MLEVTKVNVSPQMCCAICQHVMQVGEQVRTCSTPIPFRYGKQKKKAKANTHITLMVHVRCYEGIYGSSGTDDSSVLA